MHNRRKAERETIAAIGPAFRGAISAALGVNSIYGRTDVKLSDFINYGSYGMGGSYHCRACDKRSAMRTFPETHACTSEVVTELQRRERTERENTMANVIICDRCGAIATAGVAGLLTYQPNPVAERTHVTVCPNCSGAFYDWLHEFDNQSNRPIQRAFNPETDRAETGPGQADTSRAAINGYVEDE